MRINRNSGNFVFAALVLFCIALAPRISAQSFVPTGSLITARQAHTATLLNNGLVLIAGGYGDEGFLASAELYNPGTGTSTPTGSLNTARELHTATLLSNGKVLIAGGYDGAYLASAELYDPATGIFSPTGNLNIPRLYDTATLLNNGMVLIAGGGISGNAELYNPATGAFTFTGNLNVYRYSHTATMLTDGRVLIAGGINLSSAELYDPTSGTFSLTGSLNVAREFHTATALMNGMVLIAGGVADGLQGTYLSSAELYNPSTGAFSLTGSLNSPRTFHTATLLNSGLVLVAGGGYSPVQTSSTLASAELYNPASGTFVFTGSMNTARLYHTSTLLNNETVLVSGGGGLSGGILPSNELFETVSDQTDALINTVNALNLQAGITNSLEAKLQAILASLAANDVISACTEANSFSSEVIAQSGKKISVNQALTLISQDNTIKAGLGCS
jgi:hypothetical protein